MFKTIINLRVVDDKPLSQEDIGLIERKLSEAFFSTKGRIIMFKKMNIEEAAEEAMLHDLEPEYLNIKVDSLGNIHDLGYPLIQ